MLVRLEKKKTVETKKNEKKEFTPYLFKSYKLGEKRLNRNRGVFQLTKDFRYKKCCIFKKGSLCFIQNGCSRSELENEGTVTVIFRIDNKEDFIDIGEVGHYTTNGYDFYYAKLEMPVEFADRYLEKTKSIHSAENEVDKFKRLKNKAMEEIPNHKHIDESDGLFMRIIGKLHDFCKWSFDDGLLLWIFIVFVGAILGGIGLFLFGVETIFSQLLVLFISMFAPLLLTLLLYGLTSVFYVGYINLCEDEYNYQRQQVRDTYNALADPFKVLLEEDEDYIKNKEKLDAKTELKQIEVDKYEKAQDLLKEERYGNRNVILKLYRTRKVPIHINREQSIKPYKVGYVKVDKKAEKDYEKVLQDLTLNHPMSNNCFGIPSWSYRRNS